MDTKQYPEFARELLEKLLSKIPVTVEVRVDRLFDKAAYQILILAYIWTLADDEYYRHELENTIDEMRNTWHFVSRVIKPDLGLWVRRYNSARKKGMDFVAGYDFCDVGQGIRYAKDHLAFMTDFLGELGKIQKEAWQVVPAQEHGEYKFYAVKYGVKEIVTDEFIIDKDEDDHSTHLLMISAAFERDANRKITTGTRVAGIRPYMEMVRKYPPKRGAITFNKLKYESSDKRNVIVEEDL